MSALFHAYLAHIERSTASWGAFVCWVVEVVGRLNWWGFSPRAAASFSATGTFLQIWLYNTAQHHYVP